jgi:hypothetical protein
MQPHSSTALAPLRILLLLLLMLALLSASAEVSNICCLAAVVARLQARLAGLHRPDSCQAPCPASTQAEQQTA